MPHWTQPRAAGSAQLMISLAREEYGLSLETCIAGTGLEGAQLVDPDAEIAGQQELHVLRNILGALGPTVPFALEAGLRYRATMHGMWGFAILTSANLREAIEVGIRYADLTYSFNRFGADIDERRAWLLSDDSDNPDDLRAALVERDLGAFVTLQVDILGERIPLQALQLRTPRPAFAPRFEEVFGVKPEFGASRNAVGIDAALLDISSPLANGFVFGVCEEHCRTLLEQRTSRSGTAGRVRARLLQTPGGFPSMDQVAADLGMSTRTLRNRLATENTSYRELLEDLREALAEELLSARDLKVDQIAARLGYADPSSFVAAFKRWKGVPPSSYRPK